MTFEPTVFADYTNLENFALVGEDDSQLNFPTISNYTSNSLDSSDQLVENILAETENKDYHQIVFIDSGVSNSSLLVDDLSGASEVIVLENNDNAIAEIAKTFSLATDKLDAVHLVSHGDAGVNNDFIDGSGEYIFDDNIVFPNPDLTEFDPDFWAEFNFDNPSDISIELISDLSLGNFKDYDFSFTSFNEDTSFGEFSDLFVDNADLFSYKPELNPDEGLSLEEFNSFNESDFKALDYAFVGDEIFDADYYLDTNADVRESGENPFAHFMESGWKEGRDPHLLFAPAYYLDTNADVRESGENPLVHFAQHGISEGRYPILLSETARYWDKTLSEIDDFVNLGNLDSSDFSFSSFNSETSFGEFSDLFVDNANLFSYQSELNLDDGITIEDLYTLDGSDFKALDYAFVGDEIFDADYYLDSNADVRESGENPFAHFMEFGWKEGRNPHLLFDPAYYLDSNADVSESGENPLIHFAQHGISEGRYPIILTDTARYWDKTLSEIDYFVNLGNLDSSDFSFSSFNSETSFGEFSDLFVNNANLFSYQSELNLDDGITIEDIYTLDGSDFKALDYSFSGDEIFDADYYLANNPEVRESGVNPFTHFIESGISEGQNPHPVFEQPNQILIAQSEIAPDGGRFSIWGTAIVGGVLLFNAAKNAWEFVSQEASPFLYNPDLTGIPPFELPPENDGGISIEVFPGGINFEDIRDGSIFTNPDESELEFTGVVTTPRESDALDELINGPFVFPGSEVLTGSYVLDIGGDSSSLDDIDVTVVGQPDFPEELTQGIRLGQLEGGGTITFLGNNSQGIEGYFTPSGETVEKPFSLKNASTVGRKANLIQRINDNGIQIQRAGITDPVLLRINVPQFEAEELKNFVENGPIKNIPSEGIFEKIYFDATDGTVVVDSTGTTIIR